MLLLHLYSFKTKINLIMKKIIILLVIIIGFTSCATKKSSQKEISKSDMIANWGVESISGLDNPTTNLTLSLDLQKNTINGYGGCNKFNGSAEREGYNISFPTVINTQMFCENADVESAYMKALEKTHSFTIKNNKLIFFDKSKKSIITFTKLSR